MGKRTKLILGIILGAVIIFSGALFGLAKYGVIHIKYLADPLYGRVEVTVDQTNTGGGMALYQNGNPVPVTGSFVGNVYIVPSLAYGGYTYRFLIPGPATGQPCVGPVANLSHYSATTGTTYARFTCDGTNPGTSLIQGQVIRSGAGLTIQGATVTIGNKPAVTTDVSGYYRIDNITTGNYTATIVKSGYDTLTQTVTVADGINNKNFNLVLTGTLPSPVTGTYSLLGYVRDSATNAMLQGVTVNGSNATGSDGKYTINNLPYASYQTQAFVFHKDGYTDQTKTLVQLGLQGIIANQPTPYVAQLLMMVLAQNNQTPTIGTAIAGDVSATVTFTPQTNNGGAAITSYTVTSTPGSKTATGTASPVTVAGLTNGNSYTFTVHSTNSAGNSPESAKSNVVVPEPKAFIVLGKVQAYDDEAVAGIKLKITGPNNFHIEATSSNKFIDYSSATTSYPNTSQNYYLNNSALKTGAAGYKISIDLTGSKYILRSGSATKDLVFNPGANGTTIKDNFNALRVYFDLVYPSIEIIVKDNSTKQPIAGARVVLTDKSCPLLDNFDLVTAADGKADFISDNLHDYLSMGVTACSPGELLATISEIGYITQVIQPFALSSAAVVAGVNSASVSVFLEKPTTLVSNQISGHVFDAVGAPVANSKVILCPQNNLDCGSPTVQTYGNGTFYFNNPAAGNYMARAFSMNYADSSRSRVMFSYSGGKLDVSLYLGSKFPPSQSVAINMTVLDKNTYSPIPGAQLMISNTSTSPDQSVSVPTTDDDGNTSFIGIEGTQYLVASRVNIKGVSYTIPATTISYPADYDSLPRTEQQTINRKNIIFVNLASPTNIVNQMKISVTDCANPKPPIPSATISYTPFTSNQSEYFGLSQAAVATTNATGQTTLPDDFTYQGGLMPSVLKFSKSAPIELSISATGYQFKANQSISPDNNISICLDKISTGKHKIYVETHNEITYEIVDGPKHYTLQIQQNNTWVNAGIPFDSIVNSFTPTKNGKYLVLDQSGAASGWVNFDNTQDLTIEFTVCDKDNAVSSNLFNMGSGIYFLFTSNDMKTMYLSPDPDNSSIFTQIANRIAQVKHMSKDVGNTLIVFNDNQNINASSSDTPIMDCYGVRYAKRITINKALMNLFYNGGLSSGNILSWVTHEYGHQVLFSQISNDIQMATKWVELYNQLMLDSSDATVVFNRITDRYANLVPDGVFGHPYDNIDEMFASFFDAYFSSHNYFYGVIRYQTTGSAQNILEYMWQLFSENIGKVDIDDGNYFTPVGGKIGNAEYTFSQIKTGAWKQSNYNSLPFISKSSVQYSRIISPIINTTLTAIRTAITSLNNLVNSLFSGNTGNFAVTVQNKNHQPVANAIITIGGKVGITDSNGKTTITNIPVGNNEPITSRLTPSGEAPAILSPSGGKVNVIKNLPTSPTNLAIGLNM